MCYHHLIYAKLLKNHLAEKMWYMFNGWQK